MVHARRLGLQSKLSNEFIGDRAKADVIQAYQTGCFNFGSVVGRSQPAARRFIRVYPIELPETIVKEHG